jgi:hypothetical protein
MYERLRSTHSRHLSRDRTHSTVQIVTCDTNLLNNNYSYYSSEQEDITEKTDYILQNNE